MDDPSNAILAKVLPSVNVVSERVRMDGAVDEEIVAHRLLDIDVVCCLEWKS
jgi:hypothetical protein